MNSSKIIVLTGGPCGGKTAAVRELKKRFANNNSVNFLDEVASSILERCDYDLSRQQERRKFQEEIFHSQQRREALLSSSNNVVVCDRGLLDGAAYWPGGLRMWLRHFKVRYAELLSNYHAVFHFESLAYGHAYVCDGVRIESPGESILIDHRLKKIWAAHDNFRLLRHEQSLDDKVGFVAACVDRALSQISRNQDCERPERTLNSLLPEWLFTG